MSEEDKISNHPPDQVDDIEELKNQAAKAEEYLSGWKRAKADYLNLKKDTENQRMEIIQYANAALLSELVPVYNNLKLALEHAPDNLKAHDWVKGVEHIKRQFKDFFSNLGIEEIKTVGQQFNPEMHEAIETGEKEGFESNTIYEEVAAGYTLHGKVITPARVKVAK